MDLESKNDNTEDLKETVNNNGVFVGLDIGTTKIVCLVGKKNEHGKLEILGYGKSKSLGVKRGVVANIVQTIESIETALKEAKEKTNIDINDVAVGIAGQHIRSMQHIDYIIREDSEKYIDLIIWPRKSAGSFVYGMKSRFTLICNGL